MLSLKHLCCNVVMLLHRSHSLFDADLSTPALTSTAHVSAVSVILVKGKSLLANLSNDMSIAEQHCFGFHLSTITCKFRSIQVNHEGDFKVQSYALQSAQHKSALAWWNVVLYQFLHMTMAAKTQGDARGWLSFFFNSAYLQLPSSCWFFVWFIITIWQSVLQWIQKNTKNVHCSGHSSRFDDRLQNPFSSVCAAAILHTICWMEVF